MSLPTSTPPGPSSRPESESTVTRTVGIVVARGYAGAELQRLIEAHPRLELAFASSRSGAEGTVATAPDTLRQHPADVYVLALPDGLSDEYVAGLGDDDDAIVVDLSADHRFDGGWVYGLPEINGPALAGARRIANPGCYATAMMLALAPLRNELDGVPALFGVSGFSGAGSTPSPRNDPAVLADNLLPYQLTGHVHEREVTHQLGHPVRFAPHVAPFFRGITVTALITLRTPVDLPARYERFYAEQFLVRVTGSEVPLVRDAALGVHATVGGLTIDAEDPRRVTVVATLDNLLKGAASQAVQNINLACGFAPTEGLTS